MTSRSRHLTLLFSLVAVLLAVALPSLAQASPDGDDDPTYNAGSVFGTQYSLLEDEPITKPVTTQDPADGSSVTAVAFPTTGSEGNHELRLTRFSSAGQPTGFGGDGIRTQELEVSAEIQELLDIRVVDGNIIVLARGNYGESSPRLVLLKFDGVTGDSIDQDTAVVDECQDLSDRTSTRGFAQHEQVDAARVRSDGRVDALWTCALPRADTRLAASTQPLVASYDAGFGEDDTTTVSEGTYGNDLELGPDERVYVLVGDSAGSHVARFTHSSDLGTLNEDGTSGSFDRDPVDLAVDSSGRPIVWTQHLSPARGAGQTWDIRRLTNGLAPDASWDGDGLAEITDGNLGCVDSGQASDYKWEFLTPRPGGKVLVTGRTNCNFNRSHSDFNDATILGLTDTGQVDTGFAASGFKLVTFDTPGLNSYFVRVGEPVLQSDGKVLVPHTTYVYGEIGKRIAGPSGPGVFVGVTRLVGSIPGSTPAPVVPSTPLRPSATPTICGRRAISLVRADVKGNKVKLTGLVGAALYGKRVTIQTDPKGARNSKFTKTGTVTASKTNGAFTATVPKPKASDFISIRYRAVSGRAKSPSLKLPQRLTSRSVKSAKNTITVKGKVKKSVLGKRNKVLIRRLVCGRYRTVGSARPDRNGNYTVTFASTQIRGVAFYRAESKVLRKPGSKKYVIQYARAIAIRTTSQTG